MYTNLLELQCQPEKLLVKPVRNDDHEVLISYHVGCLLAHWPHEYLFDYDLPDFPKAYIDDTNPEAHCAYCGP